MHPKTGEEVWIPLFDSTGAALFPELMARMDAACSNRIGNGLFLLRDWVDQKGRHTAAVGNARRPDVGVRLRPTLRAAGIDPLITFALFRHGGLTELGDSELTDAQIINPDRAGRPK